MNLYIGADLGTSSMKMILIKADGEIVKPNKALVSLYEERYQKYKKNIPGGKIII